MYYALFLYEYKNHRKQTVGEAGATVLISMAAAEGDLNTNIELEYKRHIKTLLAFSFQ
jgi:hypothetical protein